MACSRECYARQTIPPAAQLIDIVQQWDGSNGHGVGLLPNIKEPDQLGKVSSKVPGSLLRDNGQPPLEKGENPVGEAGKRWIPTAAAHHLRVGFISDVKDHHPTVNVAKIGSVGPLWHNNGIVEAKSIHCRAGDPFELNRITGPLAGQPPASYLCWSMRHPVAGKLDRPVAPPYPHPQTATAENVYKSNFLCQPDGVVKGGVFFILRSSPVPPNSGIVHQQK